jgi:hypothetical protein
MLGKLMLYRIMCNTDSTCTVRQNWSGVVTETPKSASNHRNQVTSAVNKAIARNSASTLERETAVYFFIFQAMSKPPRNTQ